MKRGEIDPPVPLDVRLLEKGVGGYLFSMDVRSCVVANRSSWEAQPGTATPATSTTLYRSRRAERPPVESLGRLRLTRKRRNEPGYRCGRNEPGYRRGRNEPGYRCDVVEMNRGIDVVEMNRDIDVVQMNVDVVEMNRGIDVVEMNRGIDVVEMNRGIDEELILVVEVRSISVVVVIVVRIAVHIGVIVVPCIVMGRRVTVVVVGNTAVAMAVAMGIRVRALGRRHIRRQSADCGDRGHGPAGLNERSATFVHIVSVFFFRPVFWWPVFSIVRAHRSSPLQFERYSVSNLALRIVAFLHFRQAHLDVIAVTQERQPGGIGQAL